MPTCVFLHNILYETGKKHLELELEGEGSGRKGMQVEGGGGGKVGGMERGRKILGREGKDGK
jgi:hypothetical protein